MAFPHVDLESRFFCLTLNLKGSLATFQLIVWLRVVGIRQKTVMTDQICLLCLFLSQGGPAPLLWTVQLQVLGACPNPELCGRNPRLPPPFPHHHRLLQQTHPSPDHRPWRPQEPPDQRSSPQQQEALSAPGVHGNCDVPALLSALSRGSVSAPARRLRRLEVRHHSGAAAGRVGHAVSGGIEQRGEPPAVLLLHQDIQKEHEGRSFLSAVQQKGVLQIRTGNDEEEEHHLRHL